MIRIPAFIPMMKMKRITALVLTVLLLLPSASAQTWDCVCGRIGNQGNYCGKCGRSREEVLQTQTKADGPDVAAEILSIRNAKVGDYVTYGRYPQTAEGNDDTPIEWLVLDVQGDRALLLSRYGLDEKPYNTEYEDVTWETCTLREWLNREFLNRAFSAEEQKAIPVTNVDNGKGQGCEEWDAYGGNDTQDKVFLLSCAEAGRYLGAELDDHDNMRPRVAPTAYLLEKGVWIEEDIKTDDGAAAGWWWLRSPGSWPEDAVSVAADGSFFEIYVIGIHIIRPALWVDTGAIPWAEPGDVKTEEASSGRGKVEVGTYVTFGTYPQTAEGTDDTPIEWLVLDVKGDRALLLSRYGLDGKPYNTEFEDVTWETCTLREWLNGEFLNRAFSAEEQKVIQTITVDNSKEQGYSGWSTTGGKDTQDKVFLLSYTEANRYLGVEYWEVPGSRNNMKSRVTPTAYAVKNGAYTSDSDRTADGAAAGWWWLRSPGFVQRYAALVFTDGSLMSDIVNGVDACVRPAFWIDLGS